MLLGLMTAIEPEADDKKVNGMVNVFLGLKYEEIEQIRSDTPLATNLDEINLPSRVIAVAYSHGGLARFPAGIEHIGIPITDEIIEQMAKRFAIFKCLQYKFLLFSASSHSALANRVKKFMGDEGTIIAEGWEAKHLPSEN